MTQMWGEGTVRAGRDKNGNVKKDAPTLTDAEFTFDYSPGCGRLAGKRSAKALLTQISYPRAGSAISRTYCSVPVCMPGIRSATWWISAKAHDAILDTIEAIAKAEFRWLTVQPARRYVRLTDSRAVGRPCPACGAPIEKIQYLGGGCYFCPHCQA
jgi:hypothetical protein